MNILLTIASTILAPFLFIGASLGTMIAPEPVVQEPALGASEAIPTTIAFFETTLASAINETATTFTLTSAVDKDGTTLASSTYAFVIDEGSSNEEIVIADCTGTACINAERGISVRTGNTEVTALKKSHRRGASVKITDAPLLPLVARILRGEGEVDFTPSTGGSLVTKDYVDSLALGSTTVSATLTDDGIVELSTGLQAASSTATDDSGSPLTLHTGISTSTGGTAYTIPVTDSTGKIHEGFIGDFSSTTTFTVGSTPILNIGKYFWASSTAGTSTWSVPTGIKKVKVTITGGGGKGGECNVGVGNAAGGGGGGSGATAISWYDVSATTSIQFVVGGPGNPSKFASIIAGAGNDGVTEGTGGAPGFATGGDLNLWGGGGGGGLKEDAEETGGIGGSSFWGGGGEGRVGTLAGITGKAPGSGGSGGSCDSSGAASGGVGATGIVVIEY